jgi:PASTA domain
VLRARLQDVRDHLEALRRRERTPLAISAALLLGLLVLVVAGRSGIGGQATPLSTANRDTTVASVGRPAQVRVPDAANRPLPEARQRLAAVGLPASAQRGDPTEPGSVVVSQEPAAGTMVAWGSPVGLRTALVTPTLCDALAVVPYPDGASFPGLRSPGQVAGLHAAAALAAPELRASIGTILAWQRAHPAMTPDRWPPKAAAALDRLLIHRHACGR